MVDEIRSVSKPCRSETGTTGKMSTAGSRSIFDNSYNFGNQRRPFDHEGVSSDILHARCFMAPLELTTTFVQHTEDVDLFRRANEESTRTLLDSGPHQTIGFHPPRRTSHERL